jgi:hypothetical protein
MYCLSDDEIELCPMCAVMGEVEELLQPLVKPSQEYFHRLICDQPYVLQVIVDRWMEGEMIPGVGIVAPVAVDGSYLEFVLMDVDPPCVAEKCGDFQFCGCDLCREQQRQHELEEAEYDDRLEKGAFLYE